MNGKNSKIIFLLILIQLLGSAFGEDNAYNNILQQIRENNTFYKSNFYKQNINNRSVTAEKYKWLPKIFILANEDILGQTNTKNSIFSRTGIKLGINQKLPLGANLSLFANQNFNVFFKKNNQFGYNISAGGKLNIPVWILAPSMMRDIAKLDLYSQNNEKEILISEKQILERALVSHAIKSIGEYYVLNKLNTIDSKMIDVLNLVSKVEETKWKQGVISTLELSKNEISRTTEKNNILKRKTLLNDTLRTLIDLGLSDNDVPRDFNKWLDELEAFVSNISIEPLLLRQIEKLKSNSEWKKQVSASMMKLPNFFLSCDLTPTTGINKYDKLSESMRDTFSKDTNLRWSVSAGMKISLYPWDEMYSLNKNFKDLKSIYNLEQKIKEKNRKADIIKIKNTMTFLNQERETATALSKLNSIRLEVAKSLLDSNKISLLDYKMQKLATEKANVSLLQARLNLIIFKLKFYTGQ